MTKPSDFLLLLRNYRNMIREEFSALWFLRWFLVAIHGKQLWRSRKRIFHQLWSAFWLKTN